MQAALSKLALAATAEGLAVGAGLDGRLEGRAFAQHALQTAWSSLLTPPRAL